MNSRWPRWTARSYNCDAIHEMSCSCVSDSLSCGLPVSKAIGKGLFWVLVVAGSRGVESDTRLRHQLTPGSAPVLAELHLRRRADEGLQADLALDGQRGFVLLQLASCATEGGKAQHSGTARSLLQHASTRTLLLAIHLGLVASA